PPFRVARNVRVFAARVKHSASERVERGKRQADGAPGACRGLPLDRRSEPSRGDDDFVGAVRELIGNVAIARKLKSGRHRASRPEFYSPSFGSTTAAAVSASDAAAYCGASVVFTYLATMSFVPNTPSFSMRNSNFSSSASMTGSFASSGKSHRRRLNGPSAF